MIHRAEAMDERRELDVRRAIVVGSYAVLGVVLGWSRLAGLGRGGYCCDEISTLVEFVRPGPRTILTGAYIPNNHELYSLLGWASTSLFGESETVLRLGAAIPFIAGVVVVTAWLHVRLGALTGLLFMFLATASPLLLDLSRQARGYGLAVLAMSIVVVAALELERSPRRWPIIALCVAGVAGTWTLPHFAIAFLTIGSVLLLDRRLRPHVALGLGLSVVAIVAWYAPHVDDILDSSRQEYGVSISSAWILTAPIDQTLVPAVALLDDAFIRPTFASLIAVAAFLVLMAASPLLRDRETALIMCAGVVTTILAFWVTDTRIVPRFFSFLLVPLFMLVASGSATLLQPLRRARPTVRSAVVIATLTALTLVAVPRLFTVTRQPREALREAAAVIDELGPATTPVFAYVPHPNDIEFHLGRAVLRPRTPSAAQRVCNEPGDALLVVQLWVLEPVEIPCTERTGTRHVRLKQYARGDAIDVWLIPPAASTAER